MGKLLDKSGLVWWQWEEADMLCRDGVVLWVSSSARFYSSVMILAAEEPARVMHMALSNSCETIGDYNDDVSPKCQTCLDGGHGTTVTERSTEEWLWCR